MSHEGLGADTATLRDAYFSSRDTLRLFERARAEGVESRQLRRLHREAHSAKREFESLLRHAVAKAWPESGQRERWSVSARLLCVAIVAVSLAFLALWAIYAANGTRMPVSFWLERLAWRFVGIGLAVAGCLAFLLWQRARGELASQLRLEAARPLISESTWTATDDGEPASVFELGHMWAQTEGQIASYHAVANEHAARSFAFGLSAAVVGLCMFVFAVIASTLASTEVGAAVAALVGIGGSGIGGYIATTFIRMQQSSAEQLQIYFSQPSEMMRVLAAERVADSFEPGSEAWIAARREIVTSLLHPAEQSEKP